MKKHEYRITVFEDHAIIEGWLSSSVLKCLIRLCKYEGFDFITCRDDGQPGFKLVKKCQKK